MNGYSLWEFETQELIRDFIEEELSVESAKALLEELGLDAVDCVSDPISAEKMLMVYHKTDHPFTSDEISWLSTANNVISCVCEDELQLYFIEMTCCEEDYYIYCAALVKLFNVVYPGKNLFVFKLDTGFAVGSNRSYKKGVDDGFCVSALFRVTDTQKYTEFIYELQFANTKDFPSIIIHFSPQENATMMLNQNTEQSTVNPDYLRFLEEFEAFYGESTETEREHYLSENDSPTEHIESYKDTYIRLSHTATVDNSTSLDELEAAEAAEKRTAHYTYAEDYNNNDNDENDLLEETYLDAEELLNALLNKNMT